MNLIDTSSLLNFSLKLLNVTKEELIEQYKASLVKVVNENIENANEQVIAHQCTALDNEPKGITASIFEKWPSTNIYAKRKTPSKMGTISIKPRETGKYVCNMFCRIEYKAPSVDSGDTLTQRLLWFRGCLDSMTKIKNLKSVAFPYGIEYENGGTIYLSNKETGYEWQSYLNLIYDFALKLIRDKRSVEIILYRKTVERTEEIKKVEEYINSTLKKTNEVGIIPTDFNISDNDFEEFIEEYTTRSKDLLFYEKYECETHDEDKHCDVEFNEYLITKEEYGNNPHNECWNYDDMDIYTYTKERAVTVPNFRLWSEFFNSVDDALKEVSDQIDNIVKKEGYTILPSLSKIYTAFNLCTPKNIKAVIIGQDPYYSKINEAMGMSFSVPVGVALPPTLKNIFKELKNDGFKCNPNGCGNLEVWAKRGVFMINASLTAKHGKGGEHMKIWEYFTKRLIGYINHKCEHIVFILWGNYAKKFAISINTEKHKIIQSVHPSPLSAHNGFFGSKPFSKANEALKSMKVKEIDWNLV